MASKRTRQMISMCRERSAPSNESSPARSISSCILRYEDISWSTPDKEDYYTNIRQDSPDRSQKCSTDESFMINKETLSPQTSNTYFEDDFLIPATVQPVVENTLDNSGVQLVTEKKLSLSQSDSSPEERTMLPREYDSSDEEVLSEKQKRLKLLRQKKIIKKGETRKVRSERKRKRNEGKEYKNNKGKIVRARVFRELKVCRLDCRNRIDEEKRRSIFEEYWSLESHNKKVVFIADLITKTKKKVQKTKINDPQKQKNRQVSFQYNLRVDGELVRICKRCFQNTFDLSNGFITTVLSKKNRSTSGFIEDDRRGSASPKNKISSSDMDLVKKHILAIPAYESHYCRQQSIQKYLPPHYTLSRMYEDYIKWNTGNRIVSRKIYESVFKTMNIKIKSPQKDTCQICDKLTMLIKASKIEVDVTQYQEKLRNHHLDAETAYNQKKIEKETSKVDKSKVTYTFDLQQCLPTPSLATSVAFYKRQLWTFNLTIHRCNDNSSFNMMWHEAISGRGANNIASCLFKHLTECLPPEVKHVTLYSDTCSGQNKNWYLAVMFTLLLQKVKHLETVDHKFLVSGHTHMESDWDHSVIEKKKSRYESPIHHPRDWYQLVRLCGKSKQFSVTEMNKEHFFDFASLLNSTFQKKKTNDEGEKIIWQNIKWLRYESDLGVVKYKENLDPEERFKTIYLKRRGVRQNKKIEMPANMKSPNPVSEEKKLNLLELLPYIDETFHSFYRSLVPKNAVQDALVDEVLDEED